MNIASLTHDTRAIEQGTASHGAAPVRRPFLFLYLGDASLARECFGTSRSIDVIGVMPRSNAIWDWLPTDVQSGRRLTPEVVFIDHGCPGIDSRVILQDIAARQLPILTVIVAPVDEAFAKRCLALGAADVVSKSPESFRAVALRMGRLLLERASRVGALELAAAGSAIAESLDREAAAALALQRAQQRHASEMGDAEARLATVHAAVEAVNGQLAAANTERQMLAQRLALSAAALRNAELRHASESGAAAQQLAATKREAESRAAESSALIVQLQRTLDDRNATLARVEEKAATDLQEAVAEIVRRQADFDAQLASAEQRVARDRETAAQAAFDQQAAFDRQLAAVREEAEASAATSAALISQLRRTLDDTVATLAQVREQAAMELREAEAETARRQASFDAGLASVEQRAARDREAAVRAASDQQTAVERQLTDAVAAHRQAEARHASEAAEAAAQLAAVRREADAAAMNSAALIGQLQGTLDDTVATLARSEEQAVADRQAALDRQAEFERQLAVARAAHQQAEARHAAESDAAAQRLAATTRDADSRAAESAARIGELQRALDDTHATLARLEEQAAADRQAAHEAASGRQAEFEAVLASVEQRAAREREAAARAALEQQAEIERQLAATRAAHQQAEARHAAEADAAAQHLAAAKRDADSRAAESAARIGELQRTLDDTVAALARVTERAATDRQAAVAETARLRQSFDAELASVEARHASEAADAGAQLARVREESEAAAATSAALISQLQTTLDETVARLARTEEQAAADRHAAHEAAARRQAEFETEAARLEQAAARDRQAAAAQLAALRGEAEAAAVNSAALISQLQSALGDTRAALAGVERQAAADREAADRATDALEAEFAKSLTAEIAERTARERQLAATADALRHSEDSREAAEEDYRLRFDHAPAALCRVMPDGAIAAANNAFARLLGYKTSEQLREVDLAANVFESPDELMWIIERCLSSRSSESIETTWTRKNGSRMLVRLRAAATTGDAIEIAPEDITERRALEEKLRRSQRLEAVARYASEVAATCGNLLSDVDQEGRRWLSATEDGAVRHRAGLLLDEVARAAQSLRQLVAFGREEAHAPALVDLTRTLKDLEPVLRRVAGSDIDLVLPADAAPLNLDVDADRVERMLVNVAAYGRERMPFGGRLTFQVSPTEVDRQFTAKYPNVRPGAHVLLTINETRNAARPGARLAEPHDVYTGSAQTRRVDIATLQALVSGCGGHLWMMAEPKGDMVLKIRLPRRPLDDQLDGPAFAPARWMKRAVSLLT